jgi:hypothetical protein
MSWVEPDRCIWPFLLGFVFRRLTEHKAGSSTSSLEVHCAHGERNHD